MKISPVLMLGVVVAATFGGPSLARAATGNLVVEAAILEALSVGCGTAMNFGQLAANVGGTVVIGTNGQRTASAGLGVAGGTESAGVCTLQGTPDYDISVDADDAVLSNGSDDIEITNFVFNDGGGDSAGSILTRTRSGPPDEIDIRIGATLNVDASDSAGDYTGFVTINADYQ